jgi:FAD synthase
MLETLGCEIQASEFRAKATREARNKVTDHKLRQALREGRLNDAEALLGLVS